MLPYLDTSVLIPLYIPEGRSAEVSKLIEASAVVPYVSDLCVTEFSSALGLRVRRDDIAEQKAYEAIDTLTDDLISGRYRVLSLGRATFEQANRLIRNFQVGLRAADALHLALIEAHSRLTLVTADVGLSQAADHYGIKCQHLR